MQKRGLVSWRRRIPFRRDLSRFVSQRRRAAGASGSGAVLTDRNSRMSARPKQLLGRKNERDGGTSVAQTGHGREGGREGRKEGIALWGRPRPSPAIAR